MKPFQIQIEMKTVQMQSMLIKGFVAEGKTKFYIKQHLQYLSDYQHWDCVSCWHMGTSTPSHTRTNKHVQQDKCALRLRCWSFHESNQKYSLGRTKLESA